MVFYFLCIRISISRIEISFGISEQDILGKYRSRCQNVRNVGVNMKLLKECLKTTSDFLQVSVVVSICLA